jgi:hypothetical protein
VSCILDIHELSMQGRSPCSHHPSELVLRGSLKNSRNNVLNYVSRRN